MTQLMSSQISRSEPMGVSNGLASSASTPSLSMPTLKATESILPTTMAFSSDAIDTDDVESQRTIATGIPTSDVSSETSISPSLSGNSPITAQLPSRSSSTSSSSTPPLTSQNTSSSPPVITNFALDPGYPITSSSTSDQIQLQTLPVVDGAAGIDQTLAMSPGRSSHTFYDSSAAVIVSPRSASISATSTFPVLPSTSVIGDGQRNTTSILPGKQDDGFMTGSGPIIIGSACGVFVVGVVIIIALMCALRRKSHKKAPKRDPRMDDLWVDIGKSDDTLPVTPVNTCLEPYDNQLPVPPEQLFRATHGYISKQDGYLSFVVGDFIRITEVSDNNWWRGVALKDGTTGWFPSDYVEQVKDNELADTNPYHVEDEVTLDPQGQVSSFQIKKSGPEDARPLVKENVAAHGTLESKDITDDVAFWVKMAASVSMSSLRAIDTIATCSTVHDYSTSVKGVHFRAIYSYKPVCKGELGLKEGELVICKERDRNGWMLGVKSRTKEEGWFPAVYVDEVSSEDATLREEDVPASYDFLDSNKLHNVSQPWTGIEHKVIHPYRSEILGDLNFECGDVIIVFQTLVNGWWFGSKGKQSGWFPGAFVEMTADDSVHKEATSTQSFEENNIGQESTQETPPHDLSTPKKEPTNERHPELSPLFSFSATNSPRDSTASSLASDNDLKPLVSQKHATMDSRFKKALRPNRKAPAAPTSLLASKLKDFVHQDGTSSLRRPVRRAPAPPIRQHSKADSDTKSLSSMNVKKDTKTAPPFKKPIYLINGKKPKLITVSPDIFDEKCLNPMIRPATRGLAPVLSTQDDKIVQKPMKNLHDVERRSKPRPLTPLHLLIAGHRNSSASRTSYGSNTDTITSDHTLCGYGNSPVQDHEKESFVTSPSTLSQCSTPSVLQGMTARNNPTVPPLPPPVVPTATQLSDDLQYPPPPMDGHPDHLNYAEKTFHNITESVPLAETSNQNMGSKERKHSSQNIKTKEESTTSKSANPDDVIPNQNQAFRRMSSTQKTPPSTLPKPRHYSNKSPLSSFGKGSEQMEEAEENGLDMTPPGEVRRKPSEALMDETGAAPSRESVTLIPGTVSEIVHHLNSMSPQSAFPPVSDGTELALIIPQRKQSNACPHTPSNGICITSPPDLHNGHDTDYTEQDSHAYEPKDTKEVAKDMSNINEQILQKNTFVPIKEDLHQIEDRVSTFRSLPRPSKKTSQDRVSLTLALEGDDYLHAKPNQHVPFFEPSNFYEKATEL